MTSGTSDPERTPKIPQLAKGGAVAPAALVLSPVADSPGQCVGGRRSPELANRGERRGELAQEAGKIGSAARANPCAVLVPSCGFRLSAGGAQVDRRTRVAQLRAGQTGI